MKLITLYLPEPYIEKLAKLVDQKRYPNRAEAIRFAIRDLILSEETKANASPFAKGDLVELTTEGKNAFPSKANTLPWAVASTRWDKVQWLVRVEHQGLRVNRPVRETFSEHWLRKVEKA